MTFRFILAVLFLIVAVPCLIMGKKKVAVDGEEVPVPARWIGLGFLGLGVLFLALSCLRMVEPGKVGVPVTFGNVGTPVGPGVHIVNPFAKMETMSIRTENYTMSFVSGEGSKTGDDSVSVLGADGAPAQVDATVLFHLDKGSAGDVFGTFGTGYVEKIVRPSIRTCIRSEFAKIPLVDAATSRRGDISTGVQDCVDGELKDTGIVLENFQLRDIHLGETVQTSINAKVAAQQTSEQQKFELSKTQQLAEIARVDAQGKADAQRIVSCGGKSIPDEATGGTKVVPREDHECLNTLSPEYLQYLYINSLQAIAASPNHSTIIVPFDQELTPLINTGGK